MVNVPKQGGHRNNTSALFRLFTFLVISLMFSTFIGCANMTDGKAPKSATESEGTKFVRVIQGEKQIRTYLAEQGHPYDPNIKSIILQFNSRPSSLPQKQQPEARWGGWDKPSYFIDNLKSYRATDRWHVLRLYKFPKGTAMMPDSFTESIEFSAQGGVDAEIVSAKLGFDVTRSTTISASWSGYYDYPVTITVYPVYEYITGSLFETVDGRTRHVGTFTVKKPIGTEIQVS